MEHGFYIKSKGEQNRILTLIGLAALLMVLLGLFLSWITGIYLLGLLTFSLVLSLIAPFFDTPSLVKSGKLKYHSLLFLSEKPGKGVIKIHGGTLKDTMTFEVELSDLVAQKSYIEQMNLKYQSSLLNNCHN